MTVRAKPQRLSDKAHKFLIWRSAYFFISISHAYFIQIAVFSSLVYELLFKCAGIVVKNANALRCFVVVRRV